MVCATAAGPFACFLPLASVSLQQLESQPIASNALPPAFVLLAGCVALLPSSHALPAARVVKSLPVLAAPFLSLLAQVLLVVSFQHLSS